MEFLRLILGEELYKQVEAKINEHNGNEANKDKLVKLANLEEGNYIHKGKYTSLEAERNSKVAELEQANNLIAELKKGTKGNEELQGKVSAYENQVVELQKQLAKEKLDNAVKLGLLENKATDIDYLTFQLNKLGELKLNDKGEVEGFSEKIEGLKKQYPNFFEGSANKIYKDNKLPENNIPNGTLTKSEILKKPYAERQKLFSENPEAFKQAMSE